MRNRAKCLLCDQIIESMHHYDYVSCSCENLSIDGGQEYFRVMAKDTTNIVRIADDDSEIAVNFDKENQSEVKNEEDEQPPNKISREDMLKMLFDQIKHAESLPTHIRHGFVTYIDFEAMMTLIYAILKESS